MCLLQTDISEKELRMFMEDLMLVSKCVECKETLNPPVNTCLQGHFSCHQCRPEKCSVCQNGIAKISLTTVSKWLQRVPRECEFSNRGCKAIILFSAAHESYCPYSYVCELCGAVTHLLDHFKTSHKDSVMPKNVVNGYWNEVSKSQLKYFVINDALFRISISKEKGVVTTEVYCMRSRRADSDYIYTLEYKNGDIQYTYTGCVLDYKAKDTFFDDDENFMNFPASKLPWLYVNGKLNYTFRISKLTPDVAILGQ